MRPRTESSFRSQSCFALTPILSCKDGLIVKWRGRFSLPRLSEDGLETGSLVIAQVAKGTIERLASARLQPSPVRIPFPVRIPWLYATTFAFLLLLLQLVTGTSLVFSLLCFFFVLTTALAFNVAGGMSRPSGSYILFFAVLSAILGLVTKVAFLEAGDSRLQVPIPLMETYLAGMIGLLVAAYLSRRVSLRKGLLEGFLTEANMRSAVFGCVIAGVFLAILAPIVNSSQTETIFTPFFRAINQVNRFLEMAIILGVTYEVKRSRGTRSLNALVITAWVVIFFQGVVLGYSKEALFSPFVSWLAAAAVLGYRFKPYQLLCAGLLFVFFYVYMVPYCQIGRVYRSTTNTFSQNVAVSETLLLSLGDVRREDKEQRENIVENYAAENVTYTAASHGLVDRLQMLSIDDALHVITEQLGPTGLNTVWAYAFNAVPRVLWKSKPDILTANQYGHELGYLAPEDESTSVSVSPIGEAYRIAMWGGILILLPVVWFILFVVVDSVCGDPRNSPWAILVIALFAHTANEGGVAFPVYMVTFGIFGIFFVAFFTAYVFPVLASLVIPTRKRALVRPRTTAAQPR